MLSSQNYPRVLQPSCFAVDYDFSVTHTRPKIAPFIRSQSISLQAVSNLRETTTPNLKKHPLPSAQSPRRKNQRNKSPARPAPRPPTPTHFPSFPYNKMINAVLIFNNKGQPRLTKFYTHLDTSVQQRLLSEIFTLVSRRPSSACKFLPLPPLLSPTSSGASLSNDLPSLSDDSSSASASLSSDLPSLITYGQYATLYFILISTSTESPLALIDFIQCYVEALDRLFENVCELDLIFNFEVLHAVLNEMIVGGVVVEVGIEKVVMGVKEQGRIVKRRAVNERGGGWGGR